MAPLALSAAQLGSRVALQPASHADLHAPAQASSAVLAAAFVVACLNGWAVRWLNEPVTGAAALPVSIYEVIALVVGVRALSRVAVPPVAKAAAFVVVLAAALVPSGLFAWAGLIAACALVAVAAGPVAWRALLPFAGVALCHLLQSPLFWSMAQGLLRLEAGAVRQLAGVVSALPGISGNLLLLQDGRSLLLLPGCSVLALAAPALLGWVALRLVWDAPLAAARYRALLLLGMLVVLNLARLAAMTVDAAWYHNLHDGFGALALDLVVALCVFATALPTRTSRCQVPG